MTARLAKCADYLTLDRVNVENSCGKGTDLWSILRVAILSSHSCRNINCICNKITTYHVLSVVAVLAIPKTWPPPGAFRCSFLFGWRGPCDKLEGERRSSKCNMRPSTTVGEVPSLKLEKKGNRIPPLCELYHSLTSGSYKQDGAQSSGNK